jgi:hypothetical protein
MGNYTTPPPSNNCLKKWQLRGNFEANLVHLLVKKRGIGTQKKLKKWGFSAESKADIGCKMVIECFYQINI